METIVQYFELNYYRKLKRKSFVLIIFINDENYKINYYWETYYSHDENLNINYNIFL